MAIHPGYDVRFTVGAKVQTADKEIRTLGLDAIRCYFDNPEGDSIFYEYTQNNCWLECSVRLVVKVKYAFKPFN